MANSFGWEDPRKLVQALEDERRKIDAFKRELPFCMHLLNDAIERAYLLVSSKQPVLEELLPNYSVKTDHKRPQSRDEDDKKPAAANWQLWTHQDVEYTTTNGVFGSKNPELPAELKDDLKLSPCSVASYAPETTHPSRCERSLSMEDGEQSKSQQLPGVGICGNNSYQQHRKSRRCWSPELHRRFVGALQQLGGPQGGCFHSIIVLFLRKNSESQIVSFSVATPKQIRELMKVEGLTNDEVKSHLQKFRLHTRRTGISSTHTPTTTAPVQVLLESIWLPTEYTQSNGMLRLDSARNCQEPLDFFTSSGPSVEYKDRLKDHSVEEEDVSYDGDVTEVGDSRSNDLALGPMTI